MPANGRATVEFPALEVPYGFSRCEVKIDRADGFPADDLRRFAVERSDPQKALLVHNYGDSRSPLYIGAALAAAAQSAFVLESINVNEAGDRKLSNYAFVILSDLNSVPSLLENSLDGYMRSGGSLLIAAGTSAGGRSQIPIFGAHIIETRDYNRVFPVGSWRWARCDSSYPAVAKADGWTGVKFFYALNVDPGDARVIVRLGDQTPLLLEKRIGEGRVVLLTSGLDNLTNDFPLHPAFVPFIEQTARYLAGSERQGGARAVDAYLELRNAKEKAPGRGGHRSRGQAATHVERGGVGAIVPADRGRLLSAAPRQRPAERSGSESRPEGIESRRDSRTMCWRCGKATARPSTQQASTAGPAAPHKTPQTLWWYVMLLVFALAIAESVLASRYLGTQREES